MYEPLRTCKTCGLEAWSEEDLDLFKFDKTCKHNRQLICKECHTRKSKLLWDKNRNEVTRLNTYYLKTYNITYNEVLDIKRRQEHRCGICGRYEGTSPLARFVVDHCHTTGRVRGILCGSCNTALGKFSDDITTLQRAIAYLIDTSSKED